MNPDQDTESIMEVLNLDEDVVDARLLNIMERTSFDNKHLRNAVSFLKYKTMINEQEGDDCENYEECAFAAKLINHINKENVEYICRIIKLTLGLNQRTLVSKSEHLLQQILADIDLSPVNLQYGNHEEIITSKNTLYMKLCDSILNAVIRHNKKLFLPLLELPLENILCSGDMDLRFHFLNSTLPRLVEAVNGYSILDSIWTFIRQFENKKKDAAMKILSSLSNFYLPLPDIKGSVNFKSEIVFQHEFWSIILYGLMSDGPGSRKHALYLLKRCIDYLLWLKKDVNVTLDQTPLFKWNWKEAKKGKENWDNFFILIDSLEEKQSNIVLPSLKLFDAVEIEQCWLNCAFKIGLKHDNTQVRSKCIEYRLKTKISSTEDVIILLEALNDLNLYDIDIEVEQLYIRLSTAYKDTDTLTSVLKTMPNVKWTPIPFYHMIHVLYHERSDLSRHLEPSELVQIIKGLLKVHCNNIAIRHDAKYKITSFIKWSRNLSWRDLISIYPYIDWDYYSKDTTENNLLIETITNLELNPHDKFEFYKVLCENHINIGLLMLLQEQHPEDKQLFDKFVNEKVERIQDITVRQYADKIECFQDAVFIWKLSRPDDYKIVVCYLWNLLSNTQPLGIDDLGQIFKKPDFAVTPEVKEILLEMYKGSVLLIKEHSVRLDKRLLAISIIEGLTGKLDVFYKHEMLTLHDFLEILDNTNINKEYNNITEDVGRLRNAFFEKSCEILYKYIQILAADEDQTVLLRQMKELLDCLQYMTERGGYGCLKWVLKIMNIILPQAITTSSKTSFDVVQFMKTTWQEIEDLKSNNQYSICIEVFVKLICNDYLLKQAMYNSLVIFYCRKIILYGLLKSLPLYYLVNELAQKNISEDMSQIAYVLYEILVFSPVPKKDQRILENTTIQIKRGAIISFDKIGDISFYYAIQLKAIEILSSIKDAQVLQTIAGLITTKIDNHLNSKQRYYGNSQSHRMLLAGLQHLLILSLMNTDILECEDLFIWALSLLKIPHQPSIRICLEWLAALHLYSQSISIDSSLIDLMKSKGVPITSQFMIMYCVEKHKIINKSSKTKEIEFVMDFLLSHTMGQMFNIRLLAQYLATELYKKVKPNIEKYSYIIEVIQKTFVESGKEKSFTKLQQDFMTNEFDIVAHLTPAFIYAFLPRYCDVGNNEDALEKDIKQTMKTVNQNLLKDSSNDLNEFKIEWLNKHEADDVVFKYCLRKTVDITRDLESSDASGTIQKKYIPWKNMTDIDVYEASKKKETTGELIVVASLIDKLPNLGGMARTSEVFGVKTYVVDSLRRLQDKQFQGLSVSAERWVNMEEVRPGRPLKEYLMKMKAEGYAVIAAEQTSSSRQLNQFEFPKKSLLLLGHEKEGIPCDLLPMMDYCVEIPQQGLVRSLNVHVTAAIFIWEYSRQNML